MDKLAKGFRLIRQINCVISRQLPNLSVLLKTLSLLLLLWNFTSPCSFLNRSAAPIWRNSIAQTPSTRLSEMVATASPTKRAAKNKASKSRLYGTKLVWKRVERFSSGHFRTISKPYHVYLLKLYHFQNLKDWRLKTIVGIKFSWAPTLVI